MVIDETQVQNFSDKLFEGLDVNILKIGGKLSSKILIVKPTARLSWQYHNRRAVIWQVYKGSAGIVRSDSDVEIEIKVFKEGNKFILKKGVWYRSIGFDDYCLVAEIWQYTYADHPSNEGDIIRMQDDFARQIKYII